MERPRHGDGFGGVRTTGQMTQYGRRAAVDAKGHALVPRSSSPVTVYVELPCIIEQAFSTIAWDDLETCASAVRRDSDSFGSRVTESEADDQDFGDYALDFMADSPSTLESSLSPGELVPFQGCVIPPLTPQPDVTPDHNTIGPFTQTANTPVRDGAPWTDAQCRHVGTLGHPADVNKQLQQALDRQQEDVDSMQDRNLHLRQLASRAKHLASVLERLMTVRDPNEAEPAQASLSPCKRQRLDEGYETESSDSVEDMLRDISTRCNAVLHGAASGTRGQQETETVRMFGAFAGLRTCVSKEARTEGAETDESVSSFRTSVREHSTIRTQVFPNGRAFTSQSPDGGYRFRWVPDHS